MSSSAEDPAINTGRFHAVSGRQIGRYQVIDQFGRGAMGVVLRVRSLQDGRELAMKVLMGVQGVRVGRFFREIAISQKLVHPALVPVLEWGELEGRPWFVMPLIPGEDLAAVVKRGELSQEESAALMAQVARAVHYAHTQGVIHRDLKPGNIRIGLDGSPHVLDFGMAKDEDAAEALSRTGVAMGTPNFWAPEQAQGKHREVDARTDVYALGVILFELLTGQPIFPANTTRELVTKIVSAPPPRLREIRPGVDPALEAIVLCCLSKEKSGRFGSALELAEALETYPNPSAVGSVPVWVWATLVACLFGLSGLLAGVLISRSRGDPPDASPTVSVTPMAELTSLPELPLAREEIAAMFREASAQPDRASHRKALRELEAKLGGALARAKGDTALELRLYRGRARRALGNWDAAAGDLDDAAQAVHVRDEARLARAVIRLRWESDTPGALQALRELSRESSDPARDLLPSAAVARRIAADYVMILEARVDAAAEDLLTLIRGDSVGGLEHETFLALAYTARRATEQGSPHAVGWFTSAEELEGTPKFDYLYLADRAAVLAASGDLEGAELSLNQAELAAPNGPAHATVPLVIFAARGQLQSLREGRSAALEAAERRGEREAVEALLNRLEAEAVQASRPGGSEGISHPQVLTVKPGDVVRLDLSLAKGLTLYHLIIDVVGAPAALVVDVEGCDADIDLWWRRDFRPPERAEALESQSLPTWDESLPLLRDGGSGLRAGYHHLVVVRPSVSLGRRLAWTLTLSAYGEVGDVRERWRRVTEQGTQIGEGLEADFLRALRTWATRSQDEGLELIMELSEEASSTFDYRLLRANLLDRAGRWREAARAMPEPDANYPDSQHLRNYLHGRNLLHLGEPERALEMVDRINETRPFLIDVRLLEIDAALAAGELVRAGEVIELLEPQVPVEVGVRKAVWLHDQGHATAAVEMLRSLLDPAKHPTLSAIRAAVTLLLPRGESALEYVEANAERWPEGEELLALELWACKKALGQQGGGLPNAKTLTPDEQGRLALLRKLVKAR